MSAEAREAVARAIFLHPDRLDGTCCRDIFAVPADGFDCAEDWAEHAADAALAALQPIIAAEIRAWAESETNRLGCPPGNVAASADLIASRICEGDK